METETLDKLYLEIGQFTQARTNREIALERQIDTYGVALMMIREGCSDPAAVASKVLEKFHTR